MVSKNLSDIPLGRNAFFFGIRYEDTLTTAFQLKLVRLQFTFEMPCLHFLATPCLYYTTYWVTYLYVYLKVHMGVRQVKGFDCFEVKHVMDCLGGFNTTGKPPRWSIIYAYVIVIYLKKFSNEVQYFSVLAKHANMKQFCIPVGHTSI